MRKQHGFTIPELVITITVIGVLMALFFTFMVNALINYTTDTTRANMLSSAQIGFDAITNNIRLSANADATNRWPDNNGPGGNTLGWNSDADTLVLATAAEDSNGNINFSDPANYISLKNNIVYFVQDGTLYERTISAGGTGNTATTTCPTATPSCPADKKILENVQEFRVRYIDEAGSEVAPADARAIELYAKLEKETPGRPVTVEYTTRMVFRND